MSFEYLWMGNSSVPCHPMGDIKDINYMTSIFELGLSKTFFGQNSFLKSSQDHQVLCSPIKDIKDTRNFDISTFNVLHYLKPCVDSLMFLLYREHCFWLIEVLWGQTGGGVGDFPVSEDFKPHIWVSSYLFGCHIGSKTNVMVLYKSPENL